MPSSARKKKKNCRLDELVYAAAGRLADREQIHERLFGLREDAIAVFFFFNDTAPTEIYTLSYTTLFRSPVAHDHACAFEDGDSTRTSAGNRRHRLRDRKSTRLNSSHPSISYAVFCLT